MEYQTLNDIQGVPLLDPDFFDAPRVAEEIKSIHPSLHLRQSANGDFVVLQKVYHKGEVVKDHLVGKYPHHELKLIPERMRYITSRTRGYLDYDFPKELDRRDAEREHRAKHKQSEVMGEVAQDLAPIIRKQFGVQNRVFT